MRLPLGMISSAVPLPDYAMAVPERLRKIAEELRRRRFAGEIVVSSDLEQGRLVDGLARWWRSHPSDLGHDRVCMVALYAGGLPLWDEVGTAHARLTIEALSKPKERDEVARARRELEELREQIRSAPCSCIWGREESGMPSACTLEERRLQRCWKLEALGELEEGDE